MQLVIVFITEVSMSDKKQTGEILTALSTVLHNANVDIIDIDYVVNHVLANAGGEVALVCEDKNPQEKRMILIDYALCMRAINNH